MPRPAAVAGRWGAHKKSPHSRTDQGTSLSPGLPRRTQPSTGPSREGAGSPSLPRLPRQHAHVSQKARRWACTSVLLHRPIPTPEGSALSITAESSLAISERTPAGASPQTRGWT